MQCSYTHSQQHSQITEPWPTTNTVLTPTRDNLCIWDEPVFGCRGFVPRYHIKAGDKEQPRSDPCIYLGPSKDRLATRCLILTQDLQPTKIIRESRDAEFQPNVFPFKDIKIPDLDSPEKSYLTSDSHPHLSYGGGEEEFDEISEETSPESEVPVDLDNLYPTEDDAEGTPSDVTVHDNHIAESPHESFTSSEQAEEDVLTVESDGERTTTVDGAAISPGMVEEGDPSPSDNTEQSESLGPAHLDSSLETDQQNRQNQVDDPESQPPTESMRSSRRHERKPKMDYYELNNGHKRRKSARGGVNHVTIHPEDDDDDASTEFASLVHAIRNTDHESISNISKRILRIFNINKKVHFVPETYKEAITCKDANLWKPAIKDEIGAFIEHSTFEVDDLPHGRRPIEYTWLFRIKGDGVYKARLCAKGFSQKKGIDYDETYSPVVSYDTVKLSLALAAHFRMAVHQIDVKTAFLNGQLKETIYMKIPEGFQTKENQGKVFKINGALYGLKQAPLIWNNKIDQTLKGLGFKSCSREPCLYWKREDGILVLVVLYVDDMLVMSSNLQLVDQTKKAIGDQYTIKDMGEAEKFLGMDIVQDENQIKLSLKGYLSKLTQEYLLESDKPLDNPCYTDWSDRLTPNEDTIYYHDASQYREIIGKLLFASTIVRYDVAFIVNALARFNFRPSVSHANCLCRVLKYLKGTLDFSLVYNKPPVVPQPTDRVNIRAYTDADWANCQISSKSVSAMLFVINGSPIFWKSKKQSSVAQSSTEAEFYALAECIKSAYSLKSTLIEMKLWTNQRFIPIYIDNEACLKISERDKYSSYGTRHFDVRVNLAYDNVKKRNIKLFKVPTENNFSDILTKGMKTELFTRLRDLKPIDTTGSTKRGC